MWFCGLGLWALVVMEEGLDVDAKEPVTSFEGVQVASLVYRFIDSR